MPTVSNNEENTKLISALQLCIDSWYYSHPKSAEEARVYMQEAIDHAIVVLTKAKEDKQIHIDILG